MLIWREREHEEVDEAAILHLPTQRALKACCLYKFWAISGMRAQVELLTWLVDRWHVEDQCFFIGGHRLEIELEDIYFLTGLSKRGEHVSLFGTRPGGQTVASLQLEFCNDQADPRDKRIDIKHIIRPELKVIAFTVTKLCGSAALHVATGSQMRIAVDCFRGTIFNWCEAVLANIKGQLTRAKIGKLKNFGYGSIVVSFALERIPQLAPQSISVDAGRLREPRMVRWSALMARHAIEGTEIVRFPASYFHWLDRQIFTIEDFPYAGIDFRGDREMSLPAGEQWDDSDVGPQRPAHLQPFERKQPGAPAPAPAGQSAEILTDLEHHLEHLTLDIPETSIDDIPLRLQRYVIGVPGPFRRFLCRVARAVVSYRDHHQ